MKIGRQSLIIALLALSLSTGVNAQQKFLCSLWHGKSFYHELKASDLRDKTMHCSLSCALALKCPSFEVWNLGLMKEFFDLLGFGDAEWDDIRANAAGISLAKQRSVRVQEDCLRSCIDLYE